MTAALAMPIPKYFETASSRSRGTSSESIFVAKQYALEYQRLQESYTLGQFAKGLRNEVLRVCEECTTSGWDGYGAEPVKLQAGEYALSFLALLPVGTPAPSVSADPDGDITLEWYESPRQTLSVSVSPDGLLHYAALIGASKHHGSVPFYGNMPHTIPDLIYQVSPG